MRRVKFQNQYYYHIYNRGVDKRKVYLDKWDYLRFLQCLKELNRPDSIESIYRLNQIRKREAKLLQFQGNRRSLASLQPLVDIICYCLLPNHYHLLLKQLTEKGIEIFMHKIGTSYTKYFNFKNQRSGSLFQGTFKSIEVKTNEQLFYLSAYINGNAEIHGIARAENWPWSSCLDYLDERNGKLAQTKTIISQFNNINDYRNFLKTVVKKSAKRKEELKKYLIE